MIVVGLIGEDPYDTNAIQNLLNKKYGTQVRFVSISKRFTGCQLDSDKFFRTLKIESKKCQIVVCIRDLDGFPSQTHLIHNRKKWLNNICKNVSCDSVLLLNIWELEAFILGDVDTFNQFYKIDLKYTGNPSTLREPKEWLKSKTQKLKGPYKESDCPDLFLSLNYNKVLDRCKFFSTFIADFEHKIKECA